MKDERKTKLQLHKEKEEVRIPTLSNDLLFSEYSYLCGGDDYDGCMTSKGQITFDIIVPELTRRLEQIGFLDPNFL